MPDGAARIEPRKSHGPLFARRVSTWRSGAVLPLLVAIAVMFGVSGGMLWLVGLNYDGLQGGAPAKVHPSTYLLLILFGVAAIRSGNPAGYLGHVAEKRPAAVLLLCATLILFVSIALRGAPGLAGSLDTYVGASLVVLLLVDADEPAMVRIETLIHVLMTLNALLGLFEFLSGTLVFPYRFDGEVFPNDHRSTALQGHPLTNATITTPYVLALISNGRISRLGAFRLPMIALQFAALVAFGGRSGLVVSLLFGAVLGLIRLHGALRVGRVPVLGIAVATLAVTLIPLVIGGLAAGGFFDAILDRFTDDGGSAYARVQMFELFDRLTFRDLLVGPDAAYVDSIRRIAGLEWGIENPFIRTVLYQGILLTALISVAVVLYFWELARVTAPGTLASMLAFIFLINTSESIGGKTTMLAKFAVLMLTLYRIIPPAASAGTGPQPKRR